ncbi:hypothetical protein BCAMP_02010 [Brochothrix campestris FSL F6-1037]|uniref:Uncharacterized protein n=1 Tax=Brochothrix campestris FSL F6-1037 TaxID=1265861 RepID=W7CYM4_9LIST|nr:hypothetical protein BCAMP_02010 [Brochothrix campestris FSL F6-1037]
MEIETKLGQIEIADEVIATIASDSATNQVGVIGMTSKKYIRDSFNEMLKKRKTTLKALLLLKQKQVMWSMFMLLSHTV